MIIGYSTLMNILAIGAHPDDCEWACGGTAARWAAAGHRVKFVSLTNGDLGHWKTTGPELAARRKAEAARAAEILGTTSEVLSTPDASLQPTLEMRKAVVRLIRDWKADLVLTHRTSDYHPDHRAAGQLVQDSAYLVTVPGYAPESPALERNPLFVNFEDEVSAFQPDVVVAVDDVFERKLAALMAMESQAVEGGCEGGPEPATAEAVREKYRAFFAERTERHRARLGPKVRFAEAFEVCGYSASWAAFSKTSRKADDLRALFPL